MARFLDDLALRMGLPEEMILDNGPEGINKAMFDWSERTGVHLRFIEPGKPVQNTFVESFNGTLTGDPTPMVRVAMKRNGDREQKSLELERLPALDVHKSLGAGCSQVIGRNKYTTPLEQVARIVAHGQSWVLGYVCG